MKRALALDLRLPEKQKTPGLSRGFLKSYKGSKETTSS
jgi:hypothetical protein